MPLISLAFVIDFFLFLLHMVTASGANNRDWTGFVSVLVSACIVDVGWAGKTWATRAMMMRFLSIFFFLTTLTAVFFYFRYIFSRLPLRHTDGS